MKKSQRRTAYQLALKETGLFITALSMILLLALSFSGCHRPNVFTDETGSYTHQHGNRYHLDGGNLTAKGYREYKLVKK